MTLRKSGKISTLGSQITSVISVSLVLYILGLLASLGVAASRVSNSILGDVSVIVKLDPLASDADVRSLGQYLQDTEYAQNVKFTSADDVMKQEMEYNADVLDLLDENPYSAEYEIKLKPSYVHPDSITDISNHLMLMGGVDEVVSQVEMVKTVAAAARRVTIVLLCVAAVLLIISLVLIFNTVGISVYGRRFVIRTMQLVGATSGFIRRPFLLAALAAGIVSGLIASALLVCTQLYVGSLEIELFLTIPWGYMAAICGCMIVVGVAICMLSALCATNRYLRASYDLLYS